MEKTALTISKKSLLELEHNEIAKNIRYISNPLDIFELPMYLEYRSNCETNEGLVQILPYVVISDIYGNFFSYRRGSSSGESRLLSKCSIGVGGHVEESINSRNPDKIDEVSGALAFSTLRELNEEIGINLEYHRFCKLKSMFKNSEFIAMYSTLDNVDKFHLCLALQITVKDTDILNLEEGHIEDIEWLNKENLLLKHKSKERELEGWSESLLKHLL